MLYNELSKIKFINILMLTAAGIINAFGVMLFLSPVNLYDSGISGTSILLAQITPSYLTLSLFLILLNTPMFLIGLKTQGLLFTLYSIYTVLIYSLFAWLITDVFPIDIRFASPFAGTDLLLCALFGGITSGIGSGLAIRYGGAMDGIEVMAVIFAKRLGITVGIFVMIYNVLLYVVCGIILNSWILPLYSIVTYASALKVVDFIVEGVDRAKCATIITDKPDDICKKLSEIFKSGVTYLEAKGGYSNTDKAMIYFVINRFQVIKMRDIVHEIDPSAYITISEIADIYSANRKTS